jgi:hypothetical protein
MRTERSRFHCIEQIPSFGYPAVKSLLGFKMNMVQTIVRRIDRVIWSGWIGLCLRMETPPLRMTRRDKRRAIAFNRGQGGAGCYLYCFDLTGLV